MCSTHLKVNPSTPRPAYRAVLAHLRADERPNGRRAQALKFWAEQSRAWITSSAASSRRSIASPKARRYQRRGA